MKVKPQRNSILTQKYEKKIITTYKELNLTRNRTKLNTFNHQHFLNTC